MNAHFIEYILESNIFNLLLVYWMIWFFLFKKFNIINFLEKKVDEVKNSIKEAEDAKKSADVELETSRQELDNIKVVIDEMKEDYKKIASSMKEKIETETELELQNIKEKTEKVIESEVKKANANVSKVIVDGAISVSTDFIKQSLDDEAQNALIEKFIEDLDGVKI